MRENAFARRKRSIPAQITINRKQDVINVKYAYCAVFTYDDEEKIYYVNFPDIENCFTDGATLADALENAEDVLPLILCQMEDDGKEIPAPSDIKTISANENQTVSPVSADTTEYRRANDRKAVKKTLSIPRWLDTLAVKNGVNFSAVLQKALRKELNIE